MIISVQLGGPACVDVFVAAAAADPGLAPPLGPLRAAKHSVTKISAMPAADGMSVSAQTVMQVLDVVAIRGANQIARSKSASSLPCLRGAHGAGLAQRRQPPSTYTGRSASRKDHFRNARHVLHRVLNRQNQVMAKPTGQPGNHEE